MQTSYSVRELTGHLRQLIERDRDLQNVWVEGEISGMKRAPSGHYYFALKENEVKIDCVMWRSTAQQQTTIPSDGDAVLAHGSVTIYDQRSSYQLQVDRLRPVGIGDLYLQFELLKQKLEAEGLFDAARKRPLPAFPHRIGVVTSATAAAFQDVQNVLRRRYPLVEILLSPTLVQGTDAPDQIVRALERLNQRDDLDAILVCRGGGSLEDLWAFNDEGVARAIAASRVPVVSGVGHETDFTIADFAADVRAPTPSAAAEVVTPDVAELRAGLDRLTRHLDRALTDYIDSQRGALAEQERALRSHSPLTQIRSYRQRIDDWQERMSAAQRGRFALLRERIAAREKALVAASPQAILERGYALVTDPATGQRIKSADAADDRIAVQFHDGRLTAKVEK